MRSAMRLMPLLLACLMMGQAMAARNLLAGGSWDPAKKQFVQIAVTFKGKCSDVDAAKLLRDNAVADVKAYFIAQKKTSVADSVVGRLDTACEDMKNTDNSALAGFRTSISFVGLDNTADRGVLFRAAKLNGCDGGISPKIYKKLVDAAAAAKYDIKYNQAAQYNPNGKGPIPYVDESNCGAPAPPSPAPESPSPAPESPSPSPVPSPSPSPAPLNCSALIPNSVNDGNGNCVCTGAGFTVSAYNGTTLAACLATAAPCPAAYPIAAKDSAGTVQQCMVNINACPAQYPFILVAGNPAAIVECRPAGSACVFTGFTIEITDFASGDVKGCANIDSQCPSAYPVAYRAYDTSYQLQKCDNAPSCPKWSSTSADYTTTARTSSGQLVGCFTLKYSAKSEAGLCPAFTAVNFPINVVGKDPDTTNGDVKTLSCLAPNSTCPSTQPIQLFTQTSTGAPPVLVTCALTSVLVAGACPSAVFTTGLYPVNDGPYKVRVGPSGQIVGCSATTTMCPVAYPFPTYNSGSSEITNCSPDGSTTTCTSDQVPAIDVAGNTVACLVRSNTCPDNYPIQVRRADGVILECRAQGSTCPTSGSTFPYYGATKAGDAATLKQCWPKPTVDSCLVAPYTIEIYTNDTMTNANLVGCISSDTTTTTMCPVAYPVPYRDSSNALVQCRPTTITTCPTSASPAPIDVCTTKVVDANNMIVACIQLADPKACPSLYPVQVQASQGGNIIRCMPSGTQTCPSDYTFQLVDTTQSPAALKGCLPAQQTVTDCSTFGTYNGVALTLSGSGTVLGCTTPNPVACPASFPTAFWSYGSAWSITQCRPKLSSTCKAADANFAVNGKDASGAVVACIQSTGNNGCPTDPTTGYPIAVAPTAATLTTPTDCLAQGSTCPATAISSGSLYQPTFSLYDGATQPGTIATLVACVAVVKSNGVPVSTCTGDYGTYNTPVYSDAKGTILVSCLKGSAPTSAGTTGSSTTPCPTGKLPILNVAGSLIMECRGGVTDCTFPTKGATQIDYSTYKTMVRDAAGVLKGCQSKALATVCPSAAAVGKILSAAYPFGLLGPAASSDTSAVIAECRPTPAVVSSCAATGYAGNFPVDLRTTQTDVGVVGCMAPSTQCPILSASSGLYNLPKFKATADGKNLTLCTTASTGASAFSCATPAISVYAETVADDKGSLDGCLASGATPQSCYALTAGSVALTAYTQFVEGLSGTTSITGTLNQCSSATTAGSTYKVYAYTADSSKTIKGFTNVGTGTNTDATDCNAWVALANNPAEPPQLACSTSKP